ncbi:hypothetical protein VTJ49DRAFT_5128 [Mycothermus thermophilus]|uniref:Uncharacterized protein n=1 Tax=Humicola insolens TaxID=85995 RepID=A0ABR3V3W7_HUMIN
MARRLVAALALLAARRVAAELEPFVDVVVRVDVQVKTPAADALSAIVHVPDANALAQGDDGYDACSVVDGQILECDAAGHLDTTAVPGAAARCLCCAGNRPLSASYASCASYVLNNAAGPDATTAYAIVSDIYATCRRDVSDCRGATRFSPTTTRSPAPAECTSMADVWNSCLFKVDPMTADEYDLASCACTDSSGKRNTAIQDYAKSCIPYARTSMSTNYPIITYIASFCDIFSGAPTQDATNPLVFTTVGTRTGLDLTAPTATSTSESNDDSDSSDPSADSAANPSSSTGLAAPSVAVPGFLAWFANLFSLFLSLLMLA